MDNKDEFSMDNTGEFLEEESGFEKETQNPPEKVLKKSISFHLDVKAANYFKKEAEKMGASYRAIVNMYLRDCLTNNRHLSWNTELDSKAATKNLYAKTFLYATSPKKMVTIRFDADIIDYLRKEAKRTGLPCQALINMYLLDGMKNHRHLTWKRECGLKEDAQNLVEDSDEKMIKKTTTLLLYKNVIGYFKKEAERTGVPYLNIINMYLLDAMKHNRHLKWK